MFTRATKKQLKARIALDGPAGSGKTYTGLRFAFALAGESGRVAVIDTEHRSASKYQGESPDSVPWEFDVCELTHYAPSTYTQVLREAGRQGYDVVLVDSLSHAWEGVGGALDQVSKRGGSSFTAWKDITPQHREMVQALLSCPAHVIVTMRTKMEYVLEEQTNHQGKVVYVPKKVGMAPIQRAGMEYEFDLVCDLDLQHTVKVTKSRCPAMDSQTANCPGPPFVLPLREWLGSGIIDTQAPPPGDASSGGVGGVRLSGQQQADSYSRGDGDPCGDVIADRIKSAAKSAGIPPSKIREILVRHNVGRLSDMPQKDADILLQKLERRALDNEAPF